MCKFPVVQTPHETVSPSVTQVKMPVGILTTSVVRGQMLHMSNRPTQMRWITLGIIPPL